MSTIILLIRTLSYVVIFAIGFVVTIPIAVTSNRFGGNCLLYGDLRVLSTRPFVKLMPVYGPQNVCKFISFTHVGYIVIGFILFLLYGYSLLLNLCKREHSPFDWAALHWLMIFCHVLLLVLIFSVTCILTIGLNQFCSAVDKTEIFSRCSDLQSVHWKGLDGSSFHTSYTLAMAVSWVAVALWTLHLLLTLIEYFRFKERKIVKRLQSFEKDQEQNE